MAKDTKERILMAALDMFSKKGYEGTNIRELAASLGLVKSGIYKHYESKEAIWNALLDRMIAYYGERFGSAEHLPPVPDSLEDFVSMTMRMVNLTIHDEQIVKTRKVLTLEQYRDERARDLATKHFLTGLTEMFTRIFSGMMDNGLLRKDDPAMLAFAYTSPISALIHLCDREPEKTEEALRQVEAFSRHFVKTYTAEEYRRIKEMNSMKEYMYITLRERPELLPTASAWFHDKWGVPQEAYLECMTAYLNGETDYGWYLCMDLGRIVGGLGVIQNDFHNRKDLAPNVCAVYTEEAYRRQGIAGRLLNMAVEDMRAKGISPLYLVTDHTGFYERYGWEFLCMAQGDGEEEMTRLYIHR